jgi:hypothetical protein
MSETPAQGTSVPRYLNRGRTVRMITSGPVTADEVIGVMDTFEWGARVAEALNAQARAFSSWGQQTQAQDASIPQSCQDESGEACPPDRCTLTGPHYVTHGLET